MKIAILCMSLFFHIISYAKPMRIKELVYVRGVRDNPVIGHGLVVGLNGTGDGVGEALEKSKKSLLKELGYDFTSELNSKNIASVIVTAKFPPFGRQGQKIDVTVSSIGSASSLSGGMLLMTPLKGVGKEIRAFASGHVSVGGLERGKKFATTGTISDGAIIEKEFPVDFHKKEKIRLSLRNPDFTTSARIEKAINEGFGGVYAKSKDATTVDIDIIPDQYKSKVVTFIAILENFTVYADSVSKIVINERTGTVIAGGDIFLKPVSISHGDLNIEIKGEKRSDKKIHHIHYFDKKTTLSDLVKGLNAFGTTPEDLIAIFQALRKNGALVAEIEFI